MSGGRLYYTPHQYGYYTRAPSSRANKKFKHYKKGRKLSTFVKLPIAAAKAMKQEKKFINREVTTTNLVNVWAGSEINPTTFLNLTSMAQGDNTNERIGRSVVIESIRIKGVIQSAATGGAALGDPTQVRIIVFQDKQANNAEANAEDVMDQSGTDDVLGFVNMFEVTRFKILADRLFNLTPNAGAGNGTANDTPVSSRIFRINLLKLNMQVNFTLPTANIDAVSDNSIQICAISSTFGQTAAIRYQARAYFYG